MTTVEEQKREDLLALFLLENRNLKGGRPMK
jgi:hypothetical protein